MTQSAAPDADMYSLSQFTASTQRGSTLLFEVGSSGAASTQDATQRIGGWSGADSKYTRLQRRFTKQSSESVSLMQIRRAEQQRKRTDAANRLRKQERENRITMYRQYRAGEQPDLGIKFEEVRWRILFLAASHFV